MEKKFQENKEKGSLVKGAAKIVKNFNIPSFFKFFFQILLSLQRFKLELTMTQRLQSLFFFFSALLMGALFFMPMVSYLNDSGVYYKLFVYGFSIVSPNDLELPFHTLYPLPLLILDVVIILINFYVSIALFKAIKLKQFVSLFKISRISIVVNAVFIATFFAYYMMKTGTPFSALPSFMWPSWGAFIPLVAMILMMVASSGLKKDIDKVKSTDRIR